MSFKDKLQQVRREKKLSQEDVAVALNISRQAVAKWESGVSHS
ncbi:helix-turn-helix transcriptional regulator [Candidatus Galacturonibacter soehngenii]|uniref:Helix-turn-helix transcriptional regulator n=1 Tax=Candidatus Galacturonatibacter soehngenii TaxID=2307010 RepID=A0A7V7UDD0_9FIRM|nr:helix-turn-helix transcriptional regulator [Candidatus Galacturonibacter soehngenii]KAB1440640.1 helix-turn-helix transcriptional regulator [Candidatus Galacturonibacter soehngenii]